MDRVVRLFWTTADPMPEARLMCIPDLENLTVPAIVLDPEGIGLMEVNGHPFHPAYRFLTPVHKSDYLRSYFMNHHGGGYADLKHYTNDNNWDVAFDILERRPEVQMVCQSMATTKNFVPNDSKARADFERTPMCCHYACRPRSEFTDEWHRRIDAYMDSVADRLEAFSKVNDMHRMNQYDMPPDYPIPYFHMHLAVFQPLVLEFHMAGKGHFFDYSLKSGMDTRKSYR